MPQLDIVTYSTQILWVLIAFYFLLSILVIRILPKLQRQVLIRDDEGLAVGQLVYWDLDSVRRLEELIFF